jgi:hypothetical protein
MHPDELVAARRSAIHALCVAQAQDMISVELFELRLALLNEAPSPAAMEAIVADLDIGTGAVPVSAAAVLPDWPQYQDAPTPLRIQAVLSSNKRSGRFDVPPDLHLKAMFGELQVDLRDAGFMAAELHIEVDVFCGTVLVTLPQGAEVLNECSTFMGSVTAKIDSDVEPIGLYVRIAGSVVMGELKVRARLPTDLAPPRRRGAKGWFAKVMDSVD